MRDALRSGVRGLWLLVTLAFRADPWRASLVVVPVASVAGGVSAWVGREMVDAVASGDPSDAITWVWIGGAATATLFALLLGRFTLDMRLREELSLEVDQRLIRLCADIPTVEHFERPEYADRVELLRTNRNSLMGGVSALAMSTSALADVAITVGLLLTVHPATLVAVVLAVPAVLLGATSQRRVERVVEQTAEDERRALHLFDLAVGDDAAKELRVFGLEPEVQRRYEELWRSVERRRTREHAVATAQRALGFTVFVAGFVVALWVVARAAVEGRATAGDLYLAATLAARLTWELQSVASNAVWLTSTLRNAARYLWISDYAKEVAERAASAGEGTALPPDRLVDGIRLRNVTFRYGAGKEGLHHVDLHLPAGSTVAVVGENGAGKSTLVKLLCGMYRPDDGCVEVDGVDLRAISSSAWRDRISAGFQDHVRFELMAHEVVGVGDTNRLGDVDAAGVALDRAAGSDVLQSLSEGWKTLLGATLDGADLSGGQWQKLALGRAMMRDHPLLLVLDEPTSALDADTEHRLFERYAVAARQAARANGAITLLVSHRFSTVRMADLIVVLDRGQVIETGSHAELVALGGTYAELYELQAAAYR